MEMSEKTANLEIEDLFHELRDENDRLCRQLVFANKCLALFEKYRHFLTDFSHSCSCDQNADNKALLSELESEYEIAVNSGCDLSVGQSSDERSKHFEEFAEDSDHTLVNVISVDNRNSVVSDGYDGECQTIEKTIIDVNSSCGSRINFIRNKRNVNKNKVNRFTITNPTKRKMASNEENIIKVKRTESVVSVENCFTENESAFGLESEANNDGDCVSNELVCVQILDDDSKNNFNYSIASGIFNASTLKSVQFYDEDGVRRFRCPYPDCNTDYAGVHRVRSHIYSVHTDERPFQCNLCRKSFTRSDYLGEHMNSVHSTVVYACDFTDCTFETKNFKRLKKHKLSHTGYELFKCNADDCDRGYYSKTALDKHENFAHKDPNSTSKSFDCDWPECGLTFSTQVELRCHIRGRHDAPKQLSCEWPGCECSFKTATALNAHIINRHTGLKPFQCDWPGCDYCFATAGALRKHTMTHSELKNYECEWKECRKKFKTAYSLKMHTRVHCGERAFKCEWPLCDKSFTVNSKLLRHYRTHTNQ